MSIVPTIIDRVQRGMLYHFYPRSQRDLRIRELYLTETLWNQLNSEPSTNAEIQRIAELEADLEVFVTRKQLHPEYLFGLDPPGCGVWEIRSKYDPQLRVFGMFVAKDRFIATHFENRNELGNFDSEDWKLAKKKTKAQIRQLIYPFQPLFDSSIQTLITGAMNERYFRN